MFACEQGGIIRGMGSPNPTPTALVKAYKDTNYIIASNHEDVVGNSQQSNARYIALGRTTQSFSWYNWGVNYVQLLWYAAGYINLS